MKRVVILGAGLSGLTAAYTLQKEGHSIQILEKEERAGGWIQTHFHEGFQFELGPRGFLSSGKGASTLKLIEELGLTPKLKAFRESQRLLLHNSKLVTPSYFFSLLPHLWKKKAPFMEEETIFSFFQSYLGTKLTKKIVDPFVRGIFGGKMEELSMQACFPEMAKLFTQKPLWQIALKMRREKGTLLTLEGGMESLVQELYKRVFSCLQFGVKATSFYRQNGEIIIETNRGVIVADLLIVAIPLPSHLTFASMTLLHMGFDTPLQQKGFGYLTAHPEKMLGMGFGEKTLTAYFPGEMEESEALTHALDASDRYLNIKNAPLTTYHFIAKGAIPQYRLGHAQRMKKLELPHVHYIGQSHQAVGVNSLIHEAAQLPSLIGND